mgnify:CR=1 FL=1
MSSVKCSKCGAGIHYHGEPDGTEYIYIPKSDWDIITSSHFDPAEKIFDDTKDYPKLFRSGTIEEDFPAAIHKFWQCPKCGTLLFFDDEGNVVSIFEPSKCDAHAHISDKIASTAFHKFVYVDCRHYT